MEDDQLPKAQLVIGNLMKGTEMILMILRVMIILVLNIMLYGIMMVNLEKSLTYDGNGDYVSCGNHFTLTDQKKQVMILQFRFQELDTLIWLLF